MSIRKCHNYFEFQRRIIKTLGITICAKVCTTSSSTAIFGPICKNPILVTFFWKKSLLRGQYNFKKSSIWRKILNIWPKYTFSGKKNFEKIFWKKFFPKIFFARKGVFWSYIKYFASYRRFLKIIVPSKKALFSKKCRQNWVFKNRTENRCRRAGRAYSRTNGYPQNNWWFYVEIRNNYDISVSTSCLQPC